MKAKAIALLAFMLCVSAFLLPVTAYAVTDTTPPTVRAWISGELLHVESFDDTGVESAYINSARVNYRVDGSFDVILKDYAGTGEYVTVYAVDFAGNESNTVTLKNPYYVASAATPTPAPTAPVPASTPAPTQKPASTPTTTPSPTETPSPEPTPTESDLPAVTKPFTPGGTGAVMDNATDGDGKEFFTIITEDENVFYLVIDRQRDSENVYLLNAVTEDDLMALAEKGDGTSQSVIPVPEPTPTPAPTPTPEPAPEPEQPAEDSGSSGTIIFILIAVLATGGAGYYFKIVKPKKDAPVDDEDEDEDDTEECDQTGDADDSDYEFLSDDADDSEAPDLTDEE